MPSKERPLQTECNQETFGFTAHFSRRVEAGLCGGRVSTDGGALLLREVERRVNLVGRLGECFTDGRARSLVKHPLPQMLAQRIYGLALGYEDLNDHEQLRSDPLLALLRGRHDLEEPLAGKSTLNRLELVGRTGRYHKISYSAEALDRLLGDLFWSRTAAHRTRSCWIWTRPTSLSTAISQSGSLEECSANSWLRQSFRTQTAWR
jgi:hypothetical protein